MRIDTPTAIYIENQEEKEDKKLDYKGLKSITGGKEPPTITGNWLTPLAVGTLFRVQDKTKPRDFILGTFIKVAQDKGTVLQSPVQTELIPVDPARFCNQYDLYEVLTVLSPEETNKEKKEEENDDSNRTE